MFYRWYLLSVDFNFHQYSNPNNVFKDDSNNELSKTTTKNASAKENGPPSKVITEENLTENDKF